ncbi:helix-turn-helix domain-containing protein [Flexithrix dorotheae]|uniref:helix-turn-helix domain-containing protein n=1 Tax=Flexithrix dorotheae TaxID=70993 RepID=UPI0003636732|nr:helix-turn-helix domain-containing protein [Flexithrix dorotheae]
MPPDINPSLDTWTTIFLFASIQGFFLCFMLFTLKRGNRKANLFLGSFVFLFALTLLEYVAFWTKYQFSFPHIINITAGFPFLFGPLLFFYFQSTFGEEKPEYPKSSIHFVPFILYTLFFLPFYFKSGEEKILVVTQEKPTFWYFAFLPFLKTIHMMVYMFLLAKVLKAKKFGKENRLINKWAQILMTSFGIFIFSYASYFVLVQFPFFKVEYDYFISITMSLSIFMIGYMGFQQPKIFDQVMESQKTEQEKYKKSTLTLSASNEIIKKLERIIEEEEVFLDGDLNLKKLAEKTGVSSHQLSQVINQKTGLNFTEFINKNRVNYAINLFDHQLYKGAKLIDIAYASGFNNKVTFYNSFKKNTGYSPKKYREKLLWENFKNEKEQGQKF